MSTRMSLRYLAAALVAGLAFSLTPTAPVHADEPGYRAPRARTYVPRVRHYAPVRTVVRTRTVYVPQPVYTGCGSCASAAVGYGSAYYAPTYYAPRYYSGYYGGCGTCAQSYAAPYYWAVRYARYRALGYGYGYGYGYY